MKKSGNPWNRSGAAVKKSAATNSGSGDSKVLSNSAESKFKEAHERLQQSVKKHLETEYESSEDEEELETQPILDSVLKSYSHFGGSYKDLEKTQNYLENTFQSGAAVCLICIGTIKRIDPIWNCESCYGFLHLNCVQRWAKDSIAHLKLIQEERPNKVPITWQCPKCRKNYEPNDIPYKYSCFCGQTVDPIFQHWLVPHSCGETCNKPLKPVCGHKCLLLCHPGPCPPCPKVVKTSCFCGRSPASQVRCSRKDWSCGEICSRDLKCGKHKCPDKCHQGPCQPCKKVSPLPCFCRTSTKEIVCGELSWQCDKICGAPLSCGNHICEKVCHSKGECGVCLGQEERCCPCGKTKMTLPCDQEIPTCVATCDKPLDCGLHLCLKRCHKPPCGSCLDFLEKRCRCGLHKKEVSCHKEYLCETKCKRMRDCNSHACNRKCCDGDCPPCEKKCGKTLGCGQHKCNSVCHRGPCYPCQLTKKVTCRCGASSQIVPCGKRKPKPPKCNKLCRVAPNCHHLSRVPHKCHFGDCPTCQQVCSKLLPCGHECKNKCHSSVLQYLDPNAKPSAPWEAYSMPMEYKNLPCPPCEEPVTVECLGRHEVTTLPCFEAASRSCGRPCLRPLPCGNHFCQLLCHRVESELKLEGETPCEGCYSSCEAERVCDHPCTKMCHPPPCPECKVTLKLPCHCNVTHVYIKCHQWQTADEDTKEKLLCCGNQCPRNYECGHRCNKSCHKGKCQNGEPCKRKVKLSCPCKRLKKEVQCATMTSGSIKIECDSTCKELILKKLQEEEHAKEMARLSEEKRNKEELEKYEKKMQGRRRTRKRVNSCEEVEKSFFSRNFVYIAFLFGSLCAIILGYFYL